MGPSKRAPTIHSNKPLLYNGCLFARLAAGRLTALPVAARSAVVAARAPAGVPAPADVGWNPSPIGTAWPASARLGRGSNRPRPAAGRPHRQSSLAATARARERSRSEPWQRPPVGSELRARRSARLLALTRGERNPGDPAQAAPNARSWPRAHGAHRGLARASKTSRPHLPCRRPDEPAGFARSVLHALAQLTPDRVAWGGPGGAGTGAVPRRSSCGSPESHSRPARGRARASRPASPQPARAPSSPDHLTRQAALTPWGSCIRRGGPEAAVAVG